ncbi:MAG: HAD family phosphatase [Phycisphaerae bacterium]|nr:HAD family phosphatase [Phycisphaerae bacterium]
MLKAVIFDFDGVITDSEALHLRAFNQVLAPFGVQFTTQEYYQKYLGLSDKDCTETLIASNILHVPASRVEDLLARKKKAYAVLAATEGQIIDGVRPFLKMLADHKVSLAICSGALLAEIEATLNRAGLGSTFPVIVSADQVSTGKPDPEGFLLTLRRLNETNGPVRADECVVVEDSHWGLEAARAAGMHTLAVTNSYPVDQLAMADRVVKRLDEVTYEDLVGLCSASVQPPRGRA